MTLLPCLSCRRHARADEPACPFCGGALGAPSPIHQRVGRVTRAMILYGAVTLGGCGEAEQAPPPPPAAMVEAPMQPSEEPSTARALPPQPAAEPVAVVVEPPPLEESASERRAERAHAEGRKYPPRRVRRIPDRHINVAMPYGAPPADFDLV